MNGSLSDPSIRYNRKSFAARPFPRPAFSQAYPGTPPGAVESGSLPPTKAPESSKSTVMLSAFTSVGTPGQVVGETPAARVLTVTLQVHMHKGCTPDQYASSSRPPRGSQGSGADRLRTFGEYRG